MDTFVDICLCILAGSATLMVAVLSIRFGISLIKDLISTLKNKRKIN